MTDHTKTRRQFLLAAGTSAAIGIAGCSTSASGPEGGGGDQTSQATTAAPTTAGAESTDHGGVGHHEEGGDHDETTTGGHGSGHDEGSGHEDGGGHDEGSGHEDTTTSGDGTTVHEKEDEHGGHGHGAPVGEPVEHAEVKMVTGDHGYHFEPHIVRIKPGGTVTFHNESGSHTTTAYHPDNGKQLRMPEGAKPWDSGMLTEQGATFEVTLDTPGVYDFYCAPHESLGMIGSVIVGEPDAHGQPGLSEPSSGMPKKVRTKIAELNEKANKALGHTH